MKEEQQLLKRIKRLESDIIAFKTSQPIGSDSVRVFSTQTNNIWDLEKTIVESFPGAGYGQARVAIKFKANNQVAPFGQLRWFATINGNNYNYTTPSTFINSSTVPYIFSGHSWQGLTQEELNDPTILSFIIVGSAPPEAVVRYKFVVDATDTGMIFYNEF